MSGFYGRFNLHLMNSQNLNVNSVSRVVFVSVSSKALKCSLLKLLLDHHMKI